jgi:hypothetical protein
MNDPTDKQKEHDTAVRLAKRRTENLESKKQLSMPDSIYQTQINPQIPQKPRSDLAPDELLVPLSSLSQPSPPAVKQLNQELLRAKPTPPVASQLQVRTAAQVAQALRLVSPRGTPIRPLSNFVEDNLPALLLATKNQQQQLTAHGTPLQTEKLASSAPSSRQSLPQTQRSQVLGKKQGKKEPIVEPSISDSMYLPPLPPVDPGKRTIDTLDLYTANQAAFLAGCMGYMRLKTNFAPDGRIFCTPAMVSQDYVDLCHTQPLEPFQPCSNGELCAGREPQRDYDGQGRYAYVQYVPPPVRQFFEQHGRLPDPHEGADNLAYMPLDETGIRPKPSLCLECLNNQLVYMYCANIREDRLAQKVPVPFTYEVGIPGQYVEAAMVSSSSGRTHGLTTMLRKFSWEQFIPCTRKVLALEVNLQGQKRLVEKEVRGHKEIDAVKYLGEQRCKQNHQLEARPGVNANSSNTTPGKLSHAEVSPVQAPIYPVTTVKGMPNTAAELLHRAFGKSDLPPLASLHPGPVSSDEEDGLGTRSTTHTDEPAPMDWSDMLNLANDFCRTMKEQHPNDAAPIAQPKKGQARRPTTDINSVECGDARHIHPTGQIFAQELQPARGPLLRFAHDPHPEAAFNRLDLTFRELPDAYRLLRVWFQRGEQMTGVQEPLTPGWEFAQFYLVGTPLCEATLLRYLVTMRINTLLELEEYIFGGIGHHRSWLYARALPPPGASGHSSAQAEAAANAAAQMARLKRRNGETPTLLAVKTMDYIQSLQKDERDQLGTQIVHWRDRHERILGKLWPLDKELLDPESLVGPRPLPSATEQGAPAAPMWYLWIQPGNAPRGRLYSKDLNQVKYHTELYCHETPISALRPVHPNNKLLLDTVLVDFRTTVRYLSQNPQKSVPLITQHWFPCALPVCMPGDPEYFLRGVHATERENWVRKTGDHMNRKDAHAFHIDAGHRARDLRDLNEQRSATVQVGLGRLPLPKEVRAQMEQRSQELNKLMELGQLWHARPLGQEGQSNHLILAAIVYRVNHCTDQLLHERKRLDDLEQQLKDLCKAAAEDPERVAEEPEPEEDEDDEEDEGMQTHQDTQRTSAQDDMEQLQQFHKLLERSLKRFYRIRFSQLPKSRQEAQLRDGIQASLRRMHQWKRLSYSHLQLAQVVCDAPQYDDAYLLREDMSNFRLSLYTLHYPFPEGGWCAELMQSVKQRVHLVDVVHSAGAAAISGLQEQASGAPPNSKAQTTSAAAPVPPTRKGARSKHRRSASVAPTRRDDTEEAAQQQFMQHSNPWIMLLKKIFPKACSDRDFAAKCDDLCRRNGRIFHYVLECLLATLAGLYSHCRNPAGFEQALQLHRIYELARDHSVKVEVQTDDDGPVSTVEIQPYQEALFDVFFANEELVINSIRENLLWQFANEPYVFSDQKILTFSLQKSVHD